MTGGAYVGWYSILAAKLIAKDGEIPGQAHSFEPTPRNFEILKENTRHTDNVIVNQKALWNNDGKMNFNDLGLEEEASNTLLNDSEHVTRYEELVARNKNRKIISVETIKLDTYCALRNIRPSFIKLDCEGAEYEILAGGKNVIAGSSPILAVEILPIAFDNGDFESIENFLNRFGYKPHILDNNGNLIQWKEYDYQTQPRKLRNFIFTTAG